MNLIKIQGNKVYKRYDTFEKTYDEYLSMCKIKEIYLEKKINGFTYKALDVFGVDDSSGYSMEYLSGSTISSLYWKSRDTNLFKYCGIWLALYLRAFENKDDVDALRDFTSHNIFLTNEKEVVLLDQSYAHNKKQNILEIVAYFVARQNLEEVIRLNFKIDTAYTFMMHFRNESNCFFQSDVFLIYLKQANQRLIDKNKIFSYRKRVILRIAIFISYLSLFSSLKFKRLMRS
jgi:hypothetical protein